MAKRKYNVFNYTDNIYASNEDFTLRREAKAFIKEFRESIQKAQGYYRDNRGRRLNVSEIDLEIIPTIFHHTRVRPQRTENHDNTRKSKQILIQG